MAKYLDETGLGTLWGIIKTTFLTSHQSLGLVAAGSSGTSNATTTNTGTYINLLGGGSYKAGVKLTGTSNVSVSASGGTITITGPSLGSYLTSHQSLGLVAAGSSGASNASTTNGNTYINILGDGTYKSGIKITGSTNVSVTSNSSGVITITGPSLSSYLTSHQSLGLVAAGSSGTSNATTTNGNTYINLLGGGAYKAGVKITGSTNVSVTSDSNGVITVTGPSLSSYLTSHQSLNLVVASTNSGTSNTTTGNDTTYINLLGGGSKKGSIRITGSGSTTVSATGGVITISSTAGSSVSALSTSDINSILSSVSGS